MKEVIKTEKAAPALGAYVQGISTGNLVFTSGQLGLDPETGELEEGIVSQAKRSMDNLKAILETAGVSMENVIKSTIYLADINDFAQVNEVYQSYFTGEYPARSCVQVGALPKGALVEIEMIAGK